MADHTPNIEVPLQELDKVAFLDPAGGKEKNQQVKRMTARSAIIVVGQDQHHRVFVLYAWAGRIATPKLVEKIFEVNRSFRPRMFGGEADALQSLFQDAIQLIAHDRNEPLPLVPITHSTRLDKDFRIRTEIQPMLAEGRLIFHASHHELLSEMEGFPSYPTKDLVDALASAINMLPKKALQKRKDEEAQALASYLRKTGAPSWYIEQKCGPHALSGNPIAAMMRARAQQQRLRRPLPLSLRRSQ